MTTIVDGKAAAAALRAQVAEAGAAFAARAGRPVGLDVVLVGDDAASAVYVRNKAKACEAAGLRGAVHRLPAHTSQAELLALLDRLQADDATDGVLVQLPLPKHIDSQAVLVALDPARDVDGFHPLNAGALLAGRPGLVPCTPWGCMRLLRGAGVPIAGARAVVLGRSNIVGKPMALLLLGADATVTVAHSRTRDLAALCAEADILIAAVGRPKLVTRGWVRPGAAVIDVGINRLEDGSLVGDVDFDDVLGRAGYLTPVPGGVGPMTIACLLENTVRAAWARKGYDPSALPAL